VLVDTILEEPRAISLEETGAEEAAAIEDTPIMEEPADV
jgi:hypothetical protein